MLSMFLKRKFVHFGNGRQMLCTKEVKIMPKFLSRTTLKYFVMKMVFFCLTLNPFVEIQETQL